MQTKISEMVDPRLVEAAWHRFETARALAHSVERCNEARAAYQRAHDAHERAKLAYENLERDIARGVRIGAAPASGRQ